MRTDLRERWTALDRGWKAVALGLLVALAVETGDAVGAVLPV